MDVKTRRVRADAGPELPPPLEATKPAFEKAVNKPQHTFENVVSQHELSQNRIAVSTEPTGLKQHRESPWPPLR